MISMRPGAIETAAVEWPYLDRTSLSAVLGNSAIVQRNIFNYNPDTLDVAFCTVC